MRLCRDVLLSSTSIAQKITCGRFSTFLTPLTADVVSFPEYLCHGTWIENDTAYLVASTDVGRYCLVYSASAATTTGSRELSVTGHLASCPRASHRHPVSWQVNLTSYGEHC